MTLGDFMSREVLSVAPEDTIGEAAQLMADANVGSSVVLEHGRLIGILTERDLLRVRWPSASIRARRAFGNG